MTNLRVAQRYAEALTSAAEEKKVVDRVAADVGMLDRTMRESREFGLFLKNPIISTEKKQTIFVELFGKRVHSMTNEFLRLITQKKREDLLPDIAQQFFVLRDERLGIVAVAIKAAVELSPDQQDKIKSRFEGITEKTVRLGFSLDKHVIGGFVARVGDTVYDGSVKRQLEMLRVRFAEGAGSN